MATIDTSKPSLTDSYTSILTTLRDQLGAQRRMFEGDSFSGTTPTGAVRYSSASSRFEKYNGTAWVELTVMTPAVLLTTLKTVHGAGSGLDADLLDGQDGSFYTNIAARLGFVPLNSAVYTAADVMAKVRSLHGQGSGLNADLLDGNDGSYYTPRGGADWVSRRVITNDGTNGLPADGMYIGYSNAGGGGAVTRIYGGGSVGSNVTIDGGGNMTATGNVIAYSDRRLKENLMPITDALAKVLTLTGYTFDRTDIAQRQTGLIAQDVAAVLPEAVHEAQDGMLGVSYGNLMGLMVEAFKELFARLETGR